MVFVSWAKVLRERIQFNGNYVTRRSINVFMVPFFLERKNCKETALKTLSRDSYIFAISIDRSNVIYCHGNVTYSCSMTMNAYKIITGEEGTSPICPLILSVYYHEFHPLFVARGLSLVRVAISLNECGQSKSNI